MTDAERKFVDLVESIRAVDSARGIRVAPDSAINQIRKERGLPPISFWPEGVDPLTWSGPDSDPGDEHGR